MLGIINKKNVFVDETYLGSIDSSTVIKFLDKFSNNLKKKRTLVIDQAPIQTSDKFLEKLSDWKRKNLEIFWLPTFDPPKLNLIEILWKFIKYDPQDLVRVWIEIKAYDSWNSLVKYLKNVLDNVGTEYVINFA